MDTDTPGVPIRTPSPGAERMREYRRRRRYGVLSIRVRVARELIDALIKRRYLKPEKSRLRSVTSSPKPYRTRNGG